MYSVQEAAKNSTLGRLKGQTIVSSGVLGKVNTLSQGKMAGFGVFSSLRQLMHNTFSRVRFGA